VTNPLPREILGVVWDFDGVLMPDSEQVNIAAVVKTFTDLHLPPLTSGEVVSIPGRSSKVFIPELLRARGVGSEEDAEVVSFNRKNYDVIWPGKATMAPRRTETILCLTHVGTVLALATTNRKLIIDRFLTSVLPIPNPFRVIVAGEDVRNHKPHPEVYQLVATRLDIHPSKLLAVEDTAIGVRSAKVAGLWCAAIPNSFTKFQDFSEADYRLRSLHEILTITGGTK